MSDIENTVKKAGEIGHAVINSRSGASFAAGAAVGAISGNPVFDQSTKHVSKVAASAGQSAAAAAVGGAGVGGTLAAGVGGAQTAVVASAATAKAALVAAAASPAAPFVIAGIIAFGIYKIFED